MVGGLLLVSGFKHEKQLEYSMEFNESALGLGIGGLVEYLGVPVGSVKDIYVTENNKAHVDILVTPSKVTLHEDVKAKLVLYSIATGTLSVSLVGGDPAKPELEPGSQIPTIKSPLAALTANADELLTKLISFLEKLDRAMEGMESGEVKKTLDNANEMINAGKDFVDKAKGTLDRVEAEAKSGIAEFKEMGAELKDLSARAKELMASVKTQVEDLDLAETERNANETLDKISSLSDDLKGLTISVTLFMESAQDDVGDVERDVRRTLKQMNDTFEALQDLAEYLEEDPSALIRGRGKSKGGL